MQKVKRLALNLPESLYQEIEKIAEEKQTSVTAIIRAYLKLGIKSHREPEKFENFIII